MLVHVRKLLLMALPQLWEKTPEASEGSQASGGKRRGDMAPCNSICDRDNTESLCNDNLGSDFAQCRSLSHPVETRRPSSVG